MKGFLSFYEKVLKSISIFLKYLGIFLLGAIVVSITLQVVSRYAFGRPLLWVEEFATYCFIWTVFIGAAYALAKGRHIIVTTVLDYFPRRMKKILKVLVHVGMLLFLIQAVRFGFRQFVVEAPQSTIALPWRLPRRWFYSLPFVISMSSMLMTTVFAFIEGLYSWNRKG